jgi:hypothetical protein
MQKYLNEAFFDYTPDTWRDECVPLAKREVSKRGKSASKGLSQFFGSSLDRDDVSLYVYRAQEDRREMGLVVKISVADQGTKGVVGPTMKLVAALPNQYMSTGRLLPDALFECLAYLMIDKFCSPIFPNVPAFSACLYAPSLSRFRIPWVKKALRDSDMDACPMIKVEEKIRGISLLQLLDDSQYVGALVSLREQDWASMIA